MALTIDGSSLVFTGTVTVTNFTNPTTGVCTLILTPDGGVGTLPALLQGDPGLPPTFTVNSVTTLSAGASATFVLTETSTGGAGVASAYTIDVGIPQGAAGSNGTNGTLAGCSDLSGTAAVGEIPVVTSTGPTAFTYRQLPFGFVVNPSSITNLSNIAGQSTQPMATVSIAAQSYAYIPICFATATVVGTVNTVVNLTAYLTAGTRSNDVVGEAWGYAGQATQKLSMNTGFGSLMSTTGYGVVTANTAATITLKAQETASTSDTWSISNTTASFTVILLPVS